MNARNNASARLAVTACALALAAAACGGKAGAESGTRHTTTTTAAPTTTRAVNPAFDSGQKVTITAQAFVPLQLVAEVNLPITFVNDTAVAQRVQFDHSRDAAGNIRRSAAIPPGGSWSYTPTSWESATYHSTTTPALRGQIQIQPPANP